MWDEAEPGWSTGNAFEVPRTVDTIPVDVATNREGVDASGLNSGWSGFLQGTLKQVLNYGIQRDAAKSNQELQQQRQQALTMQPLVSSTSGGGVAVNTTGLLLIVGLGIGAILLLKS